VPIAKGGPYGAPGPFPTDGVVVRSDAEARQAVEAARRERLPLPVLGLLGGDLYRTLGGSQPRRGDGEDRLRGEVAVDMQGIPVEEDRDAFLAEAGTAAAEAVAKGAASADKLREAVRLAVRRCATEWTGKKPVVSVLIVRI